MIQRITAGALATSTIIALSGLLPAGPAAACNSIDGCMHAAQRENYDMMHDGRMSTMMRSGAANMAAFQSFSAAVRQQQSRPPASNPARRRF
jgi:hypothetical protein